MQLNSSKNRTLGVFTLVMINLIAIDSLRNLPVNAETGFSIAFFYIIAGLFFLLPCVLITAELATHHPKSGGAYVWVREAFGPRWGFLNIWLQWVYNVVWYPAILSFIAVNIAYLFDPALASNKLFLVPMIIGLFSIATIVNCFGMKVSGLVSILSAVLGTMVPMLFIIGLGAAWLFQGKAMAITPSLQSFFPHMGNVNHLAFLVIIIFSLMGLEMSAVHAEEVKNPQRDFPRALIFSSLLIILTLIFSSAAIAVVVPKASLSIIGGLDQAFSVFLSAFHMKWLLPVMIIFIILGGFGGMAAWVIGPTKGLVVAAEDGLTPKIFQYRNKKGVPIAVLILQWLIVLVLCSLFVLIKSISTSYWILSDLTAQLALLFYIILFAAAIALRYKTPKNANAFRIPGGNVGIWLVGLVGILSCLTAIILGFIPPSGVNITSVFWYEVMLIGGVIVFALPPILMGMRKRQG